MVVEYYINLFPQYPCGSKVVVENLTLNGVCILLQNLLKDALMGNEVKNVTIKKM